MVYDRPASIGGASLTAIATIQYPMTSNYQFVDAERSLWCDGLD